MESEFEYRLEAAHGRLEIKATGLWSHATLDRLEALFKDLLLSGSVRQGLKALVDLRAAGTHPRDVSQRLQAITAAISHQFTRVAIILPESALATLQTRRVVSAEDQAREKQRLFGHDEAELARRWLDDEDATTAGSPAS